MITVLLAAALLSLGTGVARAQSCTNDSIVTETVSSTADAQNLSAALLTACTGVEYLVDWTGRVTIPATFNVTSGNTLTITGSSAETDILDGGWDVQLFVLGRNTTLILENVSLMRGKATESGAAVYGPEDCRLSAVDCSFQDNFAAESGGELVHCTRAGTLIAYRAPVKRCSCSLAPGVSRDVSFVHRQVRRAL